MISSIGIYGGLSKITGTFLTKKCVRSLGTNQFRNKQIPLELFRFVANPPLTREALPTEGRE